MLVIPVPEVDRATVEIGRHSPGLLEQQHRGSDVPRVRRVLLDEPVELAGGDVGKSKRRTSDRPRAAAVQVHLLDAQGVLVDGRRVVVLQTRGDQALCRCRRCRSARTSCHRHARPRTSRRAMDRGSHRPAMDRRSREPRSTHPTATCLGRSSMCRRADRRSRCTARRDRRRALLAEDCVIGIATEQQLDDRRLRSLVGPRDDVRAGRLLVDLGWPQKPVHQPFATGSGSVDGGLQQVRLAHSGEASAVPRWRT